MAGLHERKRQRKRQELVDAAMTLFRERGFDGVTVEEIVAEVEVSRSTFFRYFPTKEHLMFADHDEQVEAFRERMTDVPQDMSATELVKMVALDASRATIEAYDADPSALRERQQLLLSASSVQALAIALDIEWEDALCDALVDRLEGPRDHRALYARLLAGCLMGTVAAFNREWQANGFTRHPMEYRDHVMNVFENGLRSIELTDVQ